MRVLGGLDFMRNFWGEVGRSFKDFRFFLCDVLEKLFFR